MRHCKAGFNSTLVQLKDLDVVRECMGDLGFNSTLVQLKAYDSYI